MMWLLFVLGLLLGAALGWQISEHGIKGLASKLAGGLGSAGKKAWRRVRGGD